MVVPPNVVPPNIERTAAIDHELVFRGSALPMHYLPESYVLSRSPLRPQSRARRTEEANVLLKSKYRTILLPLDAKDAKKPTSKTHR